jgi:branched-chain amino acid transport system substrate-binding protein
MNNSDESYWICKGTKQEPHPEFEVEAAQKCDICGQEKNSVKSSNKKAIPLGFIAGVIALLLLGGLSVWWFSRGDQTASNNPTPAPNAAINNNNNNNNNQQSSLSGSPLDYSWQPERFTRGQRTLFPGNGNPNRDNGIEAFKQEDYATAVNAFKRATDANRNDPEVVILYNNALARQQGNPLSLAVVVPVENNLNSAEDILRGVAQAQNQFNANGGVDGRLLEIVIANDGNQPDNAIQIARQLISDQSILGVIGHNSSSATQAALSVYVQTDLAVVSSTSTSTDLKESSFYRTLPSDTATGQKLASYGERTLNLDKVVIFYAPDSSYSKSLTTAFENSFTGTVVRKIDLTDSNLNPGVEISRSAFQDKAQAALIFPSTEYASVAVEIAKANYALPPEQRLKLLGGDTLYSGTTLTAGGEAVDNLIVAVPWFAKSPRSQNFTSSGEKQWGGLVNWRTAMSFDATQALIKTLSRNCDRASVLSQLKQINILANETSGQEIKFSSGERQGEPVLVKVIKGGSVSPSNSDFGFELINE